MKHMLNWKCILVWTMEKLYVNFVDSLRTKLYRFKNDCFLFYSNPYESIDICCIQRYRHKIIRNFVDPTIYNDTHSILYRNISFKIFLKSSSCVLANFLYKTSANILKIPKQVYFHASIEWYQIVNTNSLCFGFNKQHSI